MYYRKLGDGEVQCHLCFRRCLIAKGERGECRNRENRDGVLYSVVYGRPSAIHIDPVEKEPQYHFLPGSSILCVGTAGCNFRCRFCQNWHLSQRSVEEMESIYMATPEAVVDKAKELAVPTISFTYNEPTAFYEYVYDIAREAKRRGLRILWHSNGTMSPEPLRELLRYTDAVTIDWKGADPEFYDRVLSADVAPVLRTLKIIHEAGVWLEIVNLVIPTLNDDPAWVRRLCEWVRDNLSIDVPLHFSRFYPQFKLTDLPPTPVETLERCHAIAREVGLRFVTLGNVPGHPLNSTYCPRCGQVVIGRIHFEVVSCRIKDGRCPSCGEPIAGVWQ